MPVAAQGAVTVSGHVTSSGRPLVGARVRITELRLERSTDVAGRYSFIVPSSEVRGQTVHLVASMSDRRVRYLPASATIVLAGGAIVQDFNLSVAAEREPGPSPAEPPSESGGAAASVDSVDLSESAGAIDLASVLAGRFEGLAVSTASVFGGSPSLMNRGPRSILGSNQPLFVVDGVPVDNTVFASSAQRFGAGGFDYGSPLGDVNLSEVSAISFLSPAEASARYGGRGANGVVLISTKNGSDGPRFGVAASYQSSSGPFVRLPGLQNQYGQGLDGKFEFFDGRGGGINDAVDQNWGPVLDGRPLPQASYTEAARPDVRLWNPRPDNARGYFNSGRTSNLTAAVQGRNDLGSFRASLGRRESRGITPRDRLNRLDGAINAVLHPAPRFDLALEARGAQTTRDNAPGTGYTEANPVFQFTRMGRQVDTDSLRVHLRDGAGKQVSWNYAGHNNPFFLALADSNYSHRYHVATAGRATYALAPWLTATARGGVDYFRDGRLFTIASGWMGGFPFYTGIGDFSKGGSEGDEIGVQENEAAVRLDGSRAVGGAARWTFGAGADLQRTRFRVRSLGVDSAVNVPAAGAPDTAQLPGVSTWLAHSSRNSAFGETGLTLPHGLSFGGTVRNAWTALVGDRTQSSLLPSARVSLDLRRAVSALGKTGAIKDATLQGSWWKDATNLDPYTIETMYAGRPVTGSVGPSGTGLLVPDPSLAPEITTGWQAGGQAVIRWLGVGLTYYRENTSGVILPEPGATPGTFSAKNAGEVSNNGIEARASLDFGDGETTLGWKSGVTVSRNTNRVTRLSGGAGELDVGPSQFGVRVQARTGAPLGVLMGFRTKRDPQSGSLVLRNGLPVADSAAGIQALGFAQPDWVVGSRNVLRFRAVTLIVNADGRIGGDLFSATNQIGTFAGTLDATAVRPDSGLLIAGIDEATKTANTQHVSAQDYYHALASIPEPWVYSGTYFKLREMRLSVALPPIPRIPMSGVTASIVGRNLYLWAKVPNVDPENVFSPYQLPGVEMGQLPAVRSVGVQITIAP